MSLSPAAAVHDDRKKAGSTRDATNAFHSVLLLLIALLSSFFIVVFFWIAFSRMNFAFQLEWVECGVLDAAERVFHHKAIYVKPTYQWVADIYTPVFYYVGALAIRLGGPSLRSLRMVSIASTFGCMAVIFFQTRAIARHWLVGLAAAGLFAALYASVDGWYDIARVDMLCLFLTLVAIALSYRGHAVLAALIFVLAYQTKQSAALVAVFVLMHEIARPRKLLFGVATFFAALFTSIAYLNYTSQGWYRYYTLQLPRHQPLLPGASIDFLTHDLLAHLGLALAVVVVGLFLSSWHQPQHRRLLCFLIATSIGTTVSSLSGRIHSGGWINALLPLYAWIAVLFGIAIACALKPRASTAPALPLQTILLVMSCMQLLQLIYQPDKFRPSKQAMQSAQATMDRIAALPGDFYTLDNTIDLTPIGKEPFANTVAVWDVTRGDWSSAEVDLEKSIADAVRKKRFAGIISHGPLPGNIGDFPPPFANYSGKQIQLLDRTQFIEIDKVMGAAAIPTTIHMSTDTATPQQK